MITLREVAETDIIPLAEFLAKNYSLNLVKAVPQITTKEFWVHRFEFWWNLNPAYTDQFPRGWVIEKDTSIVGFIGNIPVKFLIRGEVRIAAASNNWYVDPSIRGLYSLRLFNEFMKQKSASLLLFKKDIGSLMKILHKYKFEEYILPRYQKEYVFIIDKKKVGLIFFKFLFNNQRPKLSKLVEYYKRLGFLFFGYLYQKPVIRGSVSQGESFTTSTCSFCDDSFSRIWEPYLNSYDLSLSRDTSTLNWLYFSSVGLGERIVIQCRRSSDKTLAGYMVFDVQRLIPSNEGSLQLMDMCIEDDDPQILASLTSFAIEIGKQNKAALLVMWGNSRESEAYFRSTFTLRRTAQYHRYIRFPDPHDMNSGLNFSGNLCPTLIYPA